MSSLRRQPYVLLGQSFHLIHQSEALLIGNFLSLRSLREPLLNELRIPLCARTILPKLLALAQRLLRLPLLVLETLAQRLPCIN